MIKGYTPTFTLDQSKVLGNDRLFQALYNAPLSDPKRQGVCTGLSMAWVARVIAFHSETAAQREAAFKGGGEVVMYRLGGQAQDLAAAGLERLENKPFDPSTYISDRFGAALRLYGLRGVPRTEMFDNRGNAAAAAKIIHQNVGSSASKKTYRLYGIVFRSSGGSYAGHCCASYASSGKLFGYGRHLYFFDCNFGEYKVELGDANKFLAAWLQAYSSIGLAEMLSFGVEKGL